MSSLATIKLTINGKFQISEFVIDSGADGNVVSEQLINQIGAKININDRTAISTASGRDESSAGSVQLHCIIGDFDLGLNDFIVLRKCPNLLGFKFLSKHQAIIDFANFTMTMHGITMELKMFQDKYQCITSDTDAALIARIMKGIIQSPDDKRRRQIPLSSPAMKNISHTTLIYLQSVGFHQDQQNQLVYSGDHVRLRQVMNSICV